MVLPKFTFVLLCAPFFLSYTICGMRVMASVRVVSSILINELVLIEIQQNSAVKENEQQVQNTTQQLAISLPLSSQFFLETIFTKHTSYNILQTVSQGSPVRVYISSNKIRNTILLKLSSSNNATAFTVTFQREALPSLFTHRESSPQS